MKAHENLVVCLDDWVRKSNASRHCFNERESVRFENQSDGTGNHAVSRDSFDAGTTFAPAFIRSWLCSAGH